LSAGSDMQTTMSVLCWWLIRNRRAVSVDRQLIPLSGNVYWTWTLAFKYVELFSRPLRNYVSI